ncbi:MAG: hypothetical protein AAF573_15585 [Bacteroidota bacterium]
MANSILEKVNIEKTAKNIRKTTKNINQEVIKASDNFVDGAIKTGHEWNKILEKAAKNGTILFGKQQDLMFDTLEGIKEQTYNGANRFSKLVGFPIFTKKFKKAANEATETVKAKVAETRKSIDDAVENVMENDIVKQANKITTSFIEDIRPNASEAKKMAKKAVDSVTKKATTKSDEKVDDLKVIEGIGPKMAGILNDAGIKTFKQLATTKVTTIKEILAAAGPRYKMHDPTTWNKQAKLAAAGRMAELKKLQAELKGGKVVKKK